jgi:hypothetical protein
MSTSPDRHRRLRAVFDAALRQSPSARTAYVADACATDPQLAPEVMGLLMAHEQSTSFLDHPPQLWRAALQPEAHFAGTTRFRVVRHLGTGGMGAVYEVHDRIRDDVVALKTFLRRGAADLYGLKREFRSLADVAHQNLVCLYELFVEDERCFFTMELVRGVSFVDYVRGAGGTPQWHARLVPALRQLIDGLSALHNSGKLHRDVKPSNVLVTPEGRVVVLDFGLIAELAPLHVGEASYIPGGTPAYMPPEEAAGAVPSAAGDWYSVGVTLYEALTGTLPFVGTPSTIMADKGTTDPPPPAGRAPDVPADLSAICMGLLCRDPAQRLTGSEVFHQLALDPAGSTVHPAISLPVRDTPFVGRDRQLQALHAALGTVTDGHAVALAVSGPSGIGKSALLRCFLGQIAGDDVIVLAGRCYDNESVPYKALDGVVDDLSRLLVSLSNLEVERLLPPDVAALTRVFPVLVQVPAIASALLDHWPEATDLLTLRRRAFEALRQLLCQLASRWHLVVSIDDLQWADADSALLLEDLLRPVGAPRMLTLLSFRSEETAAKPFLQALVARAGRVGWSAMSLDPLTDEEARTLLDLLHPAGSILTDDDKKRLASESGGSPFVLEQLARYAGGRWIAPAHAPTFAEIFAARLDALAPEARGFLEVLAVCSRPMAVELVCDACGIERERQSLVATLRGSRFIRSSGSSERIETYHDRIRDVLTAAMAADRPRQIHGRMLRALVERGSDDCEALFEHYRGAGDATSAATQAGLAGDKAAAALAFDRAASFYGHALTLAPDSERAGAWREGLATTLANAGRPAEAAEAFLTAAAAAGPVKRIELQRRGAEQFLIGGHIDRGLDLIRAMSTSMGLHVPGTARAAFLPLLWRRARLRWRGLHFVSRPADAIDRDTLLRLDTCWSAATGLFLVDMVSAIALSARHLLMALDAGEPRRVARAMAIESVAHEIYSTGRGLRRRLTEQAKILAGTVDDPHAIALSCLADGMMTMARGEWKPALTFSEEALTILRDRCVGVTWELNMAQNLVIWALMYLGELGEVSRRVPELLDQARRSGNLYIATELCTRSNYVWLAADEPEEGERVTVDSIARWSQKGFHRQHYSAVLARIQTALYRGDAPSAWRLLDDLEAVLRHTRLTRVQVMRVESHYLRARSALAMAATCGHPPRFLPVARAAARRIARERMPWSDPISLLIGAAVAHLEGHPRLALERLHEAAARFDRADMQLYAAVTRRRIGALEDSAHARELQRQADAWMASQHIKNPAAMTRTLAAGFPDPA